MFGMMEALLSFIRRQVGLRTDSADAAGSLHAKVKESRDTISGYLVNTIEPKIVNWQSKLPRFVRVNIRSTDYSTVLSVEGSGFLTGVVCRGHSADVALRITIDDTIRLAGGSFMRSDSGANQLPCLHRFNTSILVEAASSTTNYDMMASYVLD